MTIPLLLLHGFLGSNGDLGPLMDGLMPEHPSVALNLPGHGPTPEAVPSDVTFVEVVEGLGAFAEQIETPQIDLLGYSLGGRLAFALMLRQPERFRKVVVVSGGTGIAEETERKARVASDEALAKALETEPFDQWLASWYAQPLFAGLRAAPGYTAMIERRLEGRPGTLAQALRQLSAGAQPPLRQRLATCPVRALLIAGSLDAKYVESNRALAEANPQFEALTLPGAGHAPHLEQPDAFLHAVRSFLDSD